MRAHITALDGLRGLASVYILVHHARLALTQPYKNGLSIHPEYYAWADKFFVYFFSLFKFGDEAVVVFFVLSGFVIHLKQATPAFSFSKFSIRTYLKKRILRIYPTLIFSMILCVLLDYLLFLVTGTDLINLFEKYKLKTFLVTFFLIPDTDIWGNNFPVWSLKHEWFFYLIYPLLLWLYSRRQWYPLALVAALLALYFLGPHVPGLGRAGATLSIWVLGAVLAAAITRKQLVINKILPYLPALVLIYPMLAGGKDIVLKGLVFGLVVTGLLHLLICEKIPPLSNFLCKFAKLGAWSYTIYLLHLPIINLYQALILHYSTGGALPYHLWHVIIAILFILPITYFFYTFTERLAIRYKQKLNWRNL